MAQLSSVYMIHASDAPQHTGKLHEILQNLKTENRIEGFRAMDPDEDISSIIENVKDDDLILILLTNQLESQKEQIEHKFKDYKENNPNIRIAEIIVDHAVYENAFITFPDDLKPIRNREDMDDVWNGIEQSLKELFPLKKKEDPVSPSTDWSKYLKIAGIIIGVVLVFFLIRALLSGPSGPLMTDNFNDGDMNGWTIVDEGTNSAPSNWTVVRGEVQQSSNIYGPDVPATENRQGTFVYYDNREAFSWDNYSFSAVLRSTDNDGIGLLFRYQNRNNYYKLDLDEQRNFSKLFKMVSGVETTVANVAGPGYSQGANFNLEVRVTDTQIQVFRDGVDIFGGAVTDNSLANGTVGLYSWGNQNSFFDDVSVEPL